MTNRWARAIPPARAQNHSRSATRPVAVVQFFKGFAELPLQFFAAHDLTGAFGKAAQQSEGKILQWNSNPVPTEFAGLEIKFESIESIDHGLGQTGKRYHTK